MNRPNLSKSRRNFYRADGFVVSVPKCGRTWLRFMIQYYHCAKHDAPFVLHPAEANGVDLPNIVFTHDLWRHRTAWRVSERLKGKHLIPARCRGTKPILLLTRDLRDVLVSLYFQLSKRDQRFFGSLSQLVNDPVFGAEATVAIINTWWDEWRESSNFMHKTYEDLWADPEKELRLILSHFKQPQADARLVTEAVDFASLENMKSMESARALSDKVLAPGDDSDPESYKVRRGGVGGYVDYLTEWDIEVIEQAMKRLKIPPASQTSLCHA